MTRNVEPQMNQMHANASIVRSRSARSGTALLLFPRRLGLERERPVLLQRLERDRAPCREHGLDRAEYLAQHGAERLGVLQWHLDERDVLPDDVMDLEDLSLRRERLARRDLAGVLVAPD